VAWRLKAGLWRWKNDHRKEQRAREKALLAHPSKDDIPLGSSGRTALRKKQCGVAPKSQIIERPLLDNGSVATNHAPFPGRQLNTSQYIYNILCMICHK
jgi:hypothetical protein